MSEKQQPQKIETEAFNLSVFVVGIMISVVIIIVSAIMNPRRFVRAVGAMAGTAHDRFIRMVNKKNATSAPQGTAVEQPAATAQPAQLVAPALSAPQLPAVTAMPQTVPVEKPEPPPFVKSVINALTAEVATRGKIADEMDYPLLECQPFRFARYGDIVRRWVSIEETEFELAPLSDATVGLLNDPDVATVSLQAARVWTIKQIDNVMRAGHSLAALVDKSIPVSIEGRDKLLRFEAERAIKVVSAHAQPAPAQAAAATPVPTATAVAPAAAPQPAPAKPAVEKKARDLQRVATVEGKLAYAGERQYGEGSSSFNCYTVDVEKDNGETVELRGKMLEKCITDGRFTTGQRVRVTNLGKQWVNVLDESTRTYARRQMGTFTVEAL